MPGRQFPHISAPRCNYRVESLPKKSSAPRGGGGGSLLYLSAIALKLSSLQSGRKTRPATRRNPLHWLHLRTTKHTHTGATKTSVALPSIERLMVHLGHCCLLKTGSDWGQGISHHIPLENLQREVPCKKARSSTEHLFPSTYKAASGECAAGNAGNHNTTKFLDPAKVSSSIMF